MDALTLHLRPADRWRVVCLATALVVACLCRGLPADAQAPQRTARADQARPWARDGAQPRPDARRPANSPTLELVTRRAAVHIEKGIALANRGALFAAQAEFVLALEMIGHARDSEERTARYHQTIAAGIKALEEADDFVSANPLSSQDGLRGIVAAHQTPVLKAEGSEYLTPPTAIRRYCEYAQQRLLSACVDVPIAAQALCGLGRVEIALGQDENVATVGSPKAMVLFETAARIDPSYHEPANELGVLLARYGQLQSAERVLLQSVAAKPTAEAWYNLAVVYQRMQLPHKERAAMAQSRKLGHVRTGVARRAPIDVKLVDLATFQQQSLEEPVLGPNKVARPAPRMTTVETAADASERNPPPREQSGEAEDTPRGLFGKGRFLNSLIGRKKTDTATN